MSIVADIEQLHSLTEQLREKIYSKIRTLPDNPRIKRLSSEVNCFVIQFKDLGRSWSPEYHDFRGTYRWIVDRMESKDPYETIAFLKRILATARRDASGKIVDTVSLFEDGHRRMFHPDVIEHLTALMNT
jgi:hypothetical protein